MQYRQMLQRIYPQTPIVGRNFPPSAPPLLPAGIVRACAPSLAPPGQYCSCSPVCTGPQKVLIAQIGQYAFFAGIALVFFGEQIFRALNMAPPAWCDAPLRACCATLSRLRSAREHPAEDAATRFAGMPV